MNIFDARFSSVTGINDLRLPNQENLGGLLRMTTVCCNTSTCKSFVAFAKKTIQSPIPSGEIMQNAGVQEEQPSVSQLLNQYGPLA
ncbi:unnamed protein product [Adineta steineri]|uniref:Uncharacterized protein n=1 Tax=Adineta steineri TaxID=433720 RepID=A0A815LH67_9BILA|nr:unnamed protein product [Adineta steineri]CAF1407116.1 unnamed protein product [Adineta steineri]CAF3613723.1 unnamed protein product [Adineta steineri]CAF4068591.1 unnamed protein product [Adineta steineri]CAF4221540.1 unnamed protein product [Adineta steineri]